jgi:dipeptidyl aminopeptidase/acylaminoacyl peptidase
MIDLGALLRVPSVECEMGFDISPDGCRVAFSWNPDGQWEIFEISINPDSSNGLSDNSQPVQVSGGPGAKFHPLYSPDGFTLAYIVDFDGSENYHLILHDLSSGEHRDVTGDFPGTFQASFAWSPDNRQIAYISDQSGRFNVYVLTISEKISCQVFDAGQPAWKVFWSPDGQRLAVTVEADGLDYATYVLPAAGGPAHRISDSTGAFDAGQACWSPNSRYIAFSSDVDGNNNIGIYEISTHSITWLTEGNGEKQFPAWSPDGKSLVYVFNLGTVSWLAVQSIGETSIHYLVEPGVHYLPHFARSGKSILFCFDNACHPSDLWSLSLADQTFSQLTHSLPPALIKAEFIIPTEINYPGMDGSLVPALLFMPRARKPGPAVIIIHGGPDWFFEMTWYPIMIHMASRGWVVLAPNYRGSTGYGRAWQEASRFDFGGVDTDDIAAGAIYLEKEGLADPKRIAVTGRSHGGYLTASCLTRYPWLWAVGSAVVPFLNWFTNHKEIRPDLQQWDLENFGDPEENYDLWMERSPSFFLEKIKAPLQLICGRLDVRCPVSDSIKAEAALCEMGKIVELILYEDEGHAFLKMKNLLDSEQRRVGFLAKYLEE